MSRRTRQRWAVVSAVAVVAALTAPAWARPGAGGGPSDDTAHRADADGDRIGDDLEVAMAAGGAGRLDVIVQFTGGPSDANLAAASAAVGAMPARYEYREISAAAVSATAAQIRALARRPGTLRIDNDAVAEATLETARRGFGVDAAATAHGLDGRGVTVAVLDTGIDNRHTDLDAGKVTAFADCTSGSCTTSTPYDDHGHGTHVASIVAGDGDATTDRRHRGVAPGASLVGVKVLDHRGSGSMSNVDAGIEWVLANRGRLHIRAMNLSLSTTGCADGRDSTSALITRAASQGVAAFVSAGNKGPRACTIASPGAAADAITVAAMADPDDVEGSRPPGFSLADFSSRGPTADGRTKPDIAAAGVDISAARAGSTTGYSVKSGTSMAAPFAAGAAALALQANSELDPAGLKQLLVTTALDSGPPGPDAEYGSGRLDIHALLAAATGATGVTAPAPQRAYLTGEITSSAPERSHPLHAGPAAPIAITLVMPTWSGSSNPDLDLYLLDSRGQVVASSQGITRQETIGWRPPSEGDYELRVRRYAGAGPYWTEISYDGASIDAPAAPTGLVASDAASGAAVLLSWAPSTEDDVAGYHVYRGDVRVTVDPLAGTTHLDSGLTDGTEYTYAVTAVDTDRNESTPSATASARPTDGVPPSVPTGLQATVEGDRVSLDWDDSPEPDVVGYRVLRDGVAVGSPATSAFVDTGVPVGAHTYAVAAADQGGLVGPAAETAAGVSALPITISVSSVQVKNAVRATIQWANAVGGSVRLLRNGAVLTDTSNDGLHDDTLRKRGTYRYRVCEIVPGGSTGRCSPESGAVIVG